LTLDEIKALVRSGGVESNSTVIEVGDLVKFTGGSSKYEIRRGWDITASFECDKYWGESNLELFEYINQQQYGEAELNEVLESIQTEDHHWEWFKKSISSTSSEYEWFYLYAEGLPQAACLTYHPKASALGASNIFYIEFLAVAPWNRVCKIRNRKFFGVGSIVFKAALKFSVNHLGLSPGVSLHSLSQASGYYSKLKMVNVVEKNKESMLYFELPEIEAKKLLGAI
jgi:hypothetical protein